MSEERLTDLEIRLSFQEDALQQFDTLVTNMRDQMDRMQKQIELLTQQLRSLENSQPGESPQQEIPPHY